MPSLIKRRAEADTNSLAYARSDMCPPGGKAHALSLPPVARSPRLARLTATRLPPRPQATPEGFACGVWRIDWLRRSEADTNSLACARSNICPPVARSPRLARLTATRLPPRPQAMPEGLRLRPVSACALGGAGPVLWPLRFGRDLMRAKDLTSKDGPDRRRNVPRRNVIRQAGTESPCPIAAVPGRLNRTAPPGVDRILSP